MNVQLAQAHSSAAPPLEAFIPMSRRRLIDHCLAEERLDTTRREKFRRLAHILSAYFHHDLHDESENFKATYAPQNPDAEAAVITPPRATAVETGYEGHRIAELFRSVVRRANYREITSTELQQALESESLIDLQTDVDLDDFEQVLAFGRGETTTQVTVRRLYRKRTIDVEIFRRVALLLKFKGRAYFDSRHRKKRADKLPFEPGRTYLYLYKDVPKHDLELLFPNVKLRMSGKDRLLFGLPAVGAAVPVLFKTLPKLLLLLGVAAFFLLGPEVAARFGVDERKIQNTMPLLAAVLALLVGFGGLAVKQIVNFKNKKIRFQKTVSDTLFFRNLATNISVFHRLIDQAEESETKEAILVYYHLLINPERRFTAAELDAEIERWIADSLGTSVDFDIEGPLANLSRIKDAKGCALLKRDAEGRYETPTLDEAVRILDEVWDGLFPAATPQRLRRAS